MKNIVISKPEFMLAGIIVLMIIGGAVNIGRKLGIIESERNIYAEKLKELLHHK